MPMATIDSLAPPRAAGRGNFLVAPEHRGDDLDPDRRSGSPCACCASSRSRASARPWTSASSAIEESIDSAERTREEADKLLAEYRERLQEAREQADEIVARARQAAETSEKDAKEQAPRR